METNTKREPLRLVDGKFMRGGFVVAPVIGDREQIALLQAEERAAEERERQAKRGTLAAYGNAVVPQVVYRIFETINEYERD